jgi:hypothetical protein
MAAVTSGSFEHETHGVNPHSGAYDNKADFVVKNIVDFTAESYFISVLRKKEENIPHTPNNWVCCNFEDRRIVPTHYAIHT